ncbi:MAG: PorV/PorQ family protein [Elusimicrobia bacterium]|nr:PorV/PorQ family protein [Candidatus Obscuribacterium magneticum]
MKRELVKIIVTGVVGAAFLSTIPMPSYAAGTSAAQFLKLGAGARAAGMADAFAAIADDVTAGYWNPAGLSQITKPQLSVMQNSYLVDTQYQYLGAACPVGKSALGIALYRMDYGTMDRYTAADVKDGSFSAGSMAGSFTFGSSMAEGLRYGITAKVIRESLENTSQTGMATDAGLLIERGLYRFGLAIQHMGPKMKFVQDEFALPLTVRLGSATRLFQEKLLVGLDIVKPNDNDAALQSGIEYKASEVLFLRTGYKFQTGNALDVEGITGLTGGIGTKFGLFNLDYAFVPFGELGNTHRISLMVTFD